MRDHLFELTPLGKADKEVRAFLKDRIDQREFKRYEQSLRQYRHMKIIELALKVLLYTGVVTSLAATVGLDEAFILEKIVSYLGVSAIFALYAITSYITMIRKENYHVQREILIARAT